MEKKKKSRNKTGSGLGLNITQIIKSRHVQVGNENVLIDNSNGDNEELTEESPRLDAEKHEDTEFPSLAQAGGIAKCTVAANSPRDLVAEIRSHEYCIPKLDTGSGNLSGLNITQIIKSRNVQVGNENVLIDNSNGDNEELTGACGGVDDNLNDKPRNGNGSTVRIRTESCESEGRSDSTERKKSYAQAAGTKQFIQADTVQININTHSTDKRNVHSKSNVKHIEFKNFLYSVKNFRKEEEYILVVGQTEQVTNLDAISLVPWTAALDFDPNSRSSGLLSNVEEDIDKKRALHINCWLDKCNIVDGSTSWVFMKRISERLDTIMEDDFKKWKKQVKDHFESLVQQLGDFQDGYTDFTVVVVWPSNTGIAQHINFVLREIEENTSCSIVLVDDRKEQSKSAKSHIGLLEEEMSEHLTTIEINLQNMCTAISSTLSSTQKLDTSAYQLPKSETTVDVLMTDRQAQLLKEELEVLYLNNKTGIHYDQSQLSEEEDNFCKGGSLPWAWWYHVGAGHVDAERDIMKSIRTFIVQRHIEIGRSGCVTLYHAPGSGGTTLAQRILWDLKERTPCAQIKHRTGSSIPDLTDKIQLLSDKTRLPILLLMDGEDEQRVKLLQRMLREICLVILYVKRQPSSIEKKDPDYGKGIFWLQSYVSKREANVLGLQCKRKCRTDKKTKSVDRLVHDVDKQNEKHSILEFGLAVHSYEYVGIESYVKGFLRLNENTRKDLEPWQRALGILSLVYYYGQSTIPCYFFSKLLGYNETICEPKDFPPELREFIVRDTTEGKSKVIRISNYYVAKEILDKILPWPKELKRTPSPVICLESKAKLEPFAVDFIKQAGARCKGGKSSSIMCRTMTRTFISRDNKAAGVIETQANRLKKPKVSPIMGDVGSTPPYTERFNVLKQLTESFPMESQFHAHLGRLYTICRPGDEETPEKCFKKALEICYREIRGINPEDLHHSMKLTLMHIYHMYGNMYLTRVSKLTGKYLGDRPQVRTDESVFEETATHLLQSVKLACDLFSACRDVTPPECDVSFGYISEITVRLMFCDFVNSKGSTRNIHEYVERNRTETALFVENCFVTLHDLFTECFSVIEPENMDNNVTNYQAWFAALFNTYMPGHFLQRREDTIQTRRMNIAVIKMQYSNKKTYGVLEAVTDENHITFVVRAYEKNFDEADENQQNFSKKAMDIDYCEWLFAIRHPLFRDDYPIDKVLQHVQRWYDCLKTQNSRFYLFIMKSLLGFGCGGKNRNTQLLAQAQFLKDDLIKHSKYIAKPRYPREWLGPQRPSIRRLTHGKHFFGQIEGREVRYKFKAADANNLEIMKGTIIPPNDSPACGYINLDLGLNNQTQVKVFFVPVRADMRGKSFSGEKVEFVVGFSMAHGYEAFNVQKIGHVRCSKCQKLVEISSCEKGVVCPRCFIYVMNKPAQTVPPPQ